MTRFLIVVTCVAVLFQPSMAHAQRVRLLVPAYYQVPEAKQNWIDLANAQAKGTSEIIAIVNIGAGFGDKIEGGPFIPKTSDPDVTKNFYAEVLPNAKKKGVVLLGYVSTQRGARPIDHVKKDIDEWKANFPSVTGVFLDEQAVGTPKEPNRAKDQLSYYVDLRRYTIEKFGPNADSESDPRVITNPGNVGSTPDHLELYFSNGKNRTVADIMVIFEGVDLASYNSPAWTSNYPATRFAALLHHRPMLKFIDMAVNEKRIGNVFVTDCPVTAKETEWSRLPKYWLDEVQFIRDLNKQQPKKKLK